MTYEHSGPSPPLVDEENLGKNYNAEDSEKHNNNKETHIGPLLASESYVSFFPSARRSHPPPQSETKNIFPLLQAADKYVSIYLDFDLCLFLKHRE